VFADHVARLLDLELDALRRARRRREPDLDPGVLDVGGRAVAERRDAILDAVTVEMTDYTKRSIEDSTKTFEKLATAKSIDQVMEIQTGSAKRAYDDYMQQMTRLGSMYADLAKGSAKPFEQFVPTRR
jgi:hypothetical protein